MSTKLWLKSQFNSAVGVSAGVATYQYLSKVEGVLALTASATNKINGTTQLTNTAGGTVLAWISPPVETAFTLSGTITYNAWVKTSSTTGAPKTVGRVFRWRAGVETQVSTKTSTLVQSTSIQNDSFTDAAPTSTTFAVDDRIVVKFLVAATSATGTETFDYAGKTGAADGDAFVSLTETVAFKTEPEFIQFNVAGATTVTLPGTTAAGNVLAAFVIVSPSGGTVTSVSDGTNTLTQRTHQDWAAGSVSEFLLSKDNATSGGPFTYTVTPGGGTTVSGIAVWEFGGMASAAFDQASSTTGNSTAPAAPSVTTTAPNELIFGVEDSGSAATPGTGFIQGPFGQEEFMVVTSIQASTAPQTISPTGIWFCGQMTFKASSQSPSVAATGISLTLTVGNTTETGAANVTATGVSLTATVGSVTESGGASVAATGVSLTATVGNTSETGAANVTATGVSLTATVGSVTPSTSVTKAVTGVSLTATVGNVTETGSASVAATGVSLTATVGNTSESGAANVTATGTSLTLTVGNASSSTSVTKAVTGVALTATVGNVTDTGTAVVTATGVSLTASVGNVSIVGSGTVAATGIPLTLTVGSVAVTESATVPVTGLALLATVGSVNVSFGASVNYGFVS